MANTKYTNGEFTITATSYTNNKASNMFDGIDSTYYNFSSGEANYVIIQSESPYKITQICVKLNSYGNVKKTIKIHGSNDGETYSEIGSLTFDPDETTSPVIDINFPDYYTYYKIELPYPSSASRSNKVYEIKTTKLIVNSNLLVINDTYISNYYNGERIHVKIPDNYNKDVEDTYINIAGLGEKLIIQDKERMQPGNVYELVYNGSNFRIVGSYVSEVVNYKNDADIDGTANLTISDVELEEGKIYTLYIFNRPSTSNSYSSATMSISIAGKSIYTVSSHYNGFAKIDFVMLNGYLYAVGKVLLSNDTISDVKTVVAYEKKDSYSISYTANAGSTTRVSIGKDAFIKLMKVEGGVCNETNNI